MVHHVFPGSYSYMFTEAGLYYYWSNSVDEYGLILMRGAIYVEERPSADMAITVSVNGFEAEYNTAGT